jgi:hypothetical protein
VRLPALGRSHELKCLDLTRVCHPSLHTIADLKYKLSIKNYRDVQRLAEMISKEYDGFRGAGQRALSAGDEVQAFSLFLCDEVLLNFEFREACKYGDTGRMMEVKRAWLFLFRSGGLTNYARTIMEVFQSYYKELPDSWKRLFESMMVINMTGRKDGFVEADLVQEREIGVSKVNGQILLVITVVEVLASTAGCDYCRQRKQLAILRS